VVHKFEQADCEVVNLNGLIVQDTLGVEDVADVLDSHHDAVPAKREQLKFHLVGEASIF